MDSKELFDQLKIAKQGGDLDKQVDIWRQLLSISQQNVNMLGEIVALRQLGNVYQEKGQLQQAHSFRLTALDLLEDPRANCPPEEHMSLIGDLGRSFIEVKDWLNAESYIQKALAMAKEHNIPTAECIFRINLQLILENTRRGDQALELAKDVLREAETLPNEPKGQKNYIRPLAKVS
jgi:tetratricopeptide (TPR) repeat protein